MTMDLGSPIDPAPSRDTKSPTPKWQQLILTWEGNDFLDVISDQKAWKKLVRATKSGGTIMTVEALKVIARAGVTAGLATILAEGEEQSIGQASLGPTAIAGEQSLNESGNEEDKSNDNA